MLTLADGIVHLLDLLAGRDGAQAREQLRLEPTADEFVQGISPAVFDPVLNRRVALGVIRFANLRYLGLETDLELVLEGGDAVEDGARGCLVVFVGLERVLDEDLA